MTPTDWHSRFRVSPWEHQAREFDLHKDSPGRMLRWQMRTGKTKAMVDLACYRFEIGDIDGVLVVAPNNVHANWPRKELPKHHWATVRSRAMIWDSVKANNVQYGQLFEKFCDGRRRGLDWFAINQEAFSNKRFVALLKKWLAAHPRFMLIVDESHNFRNPTAIKSREVRRLARRKGCVVRRTLSGTITDNSALHAWAQFEILAPGALGFERYKDFEEHHAVMETMYVAGGKKVVKASKKEFQRLDGLQAKIGEWTSVVLRSDCDDMPAILEDSLPFDLLPAQQRLAVDLKTDTLARLDRGEVIPPKEGGALLITLQQIASGWVLDEEGEVRDVVPPEENPRLLALWSQLALSGPKTIIWCRFREDIVRVMRMCGLKNMRPVHYYGGTKKEDRARHEDMFMNDPAIGPFVGNPSTCGEGLDLSVADDIIWYSYPHGDLIKRKQANERATQKGGGAVSILNLVALDSPDQMMLDDYAGKHDISEELTGEGLRRYLLTVR